VVRNVANVQIKLSIREELLQRLESALERIPTARTANLIACEVIEDYLPLWIEAEEYRQRQVERQRAKVLKQRKQERKPAKKQQPKAAKARKRRAPAR
jgi:hypothetical protein